MRSEFDSWINILLAAIFILGPRLLKNNSTKKQPLKPQKRVAVDVSDTVRSEIHQKRTQRSGIQKVPIKQQVNITPTKAQSLPISQSTPVFTHDNLSWGDTDEQALQEINQNSAFDLNAPINSNPSTEFERLKTLASDMQALVLAHEILSPPLSKRRFTSLHQRLYNH